MIASPYGVGAHSAPPSIRFGHGAGLRAPLEVSSGSADCPNEVALRPTIEPPIFQSLFLEGAEFRVVI